MYKVWRYVGQDHNFLILMQVVCSVVVVCFGPVVSSGLLMKFRQFVYSGGFKDTCHFVFAYN